jgi:hypothetical protein
MLHFEPSPAPAEIDLAEIGGVYYRGNPNLVAFGATDFRYATRAADNSEAGGTSPHWHDRAYRDVSEDTLRNAVELV